MDLWINQHLLLIPFYLHSQERGVGAFLLNAYILKQVYTFFRYDMLKISNSLRYILAHLKLATDFSSQKVKFYTN